MREDAVLSEVADLIADLIAEGVSPPLIGRVVEVIAGGKATKAAPRKIAYTADFEAFWKAYPVDQNMSKLEAFNVWRRIDETERELAMKAINPFKEWIAKQPEGYRTIHACRFLSKKRFEGHAAQPELKVVASNPGVYVMQDSPEWGRYAEAYKAEKGKLPPVDKKGGWFFTQSVVGEVCTKVNVESA
jgi:hypothetical protein